VATRCGRLLQRLVGRRSRGYPSAMAQATPAELLQHALQLPADDRLALASELLESVEGPEDPAWADAWAAELDRRVRELDQGRVQGVPWTEVKAKMEARLRAK
jgi:putative addiction module component (TIGR02574 family)